MTKSPQLTSRDTLNVIVQRTIFSYRWAVIASFAMLGAGFVIALLSNQQVDSEMGSPLAIIRQLFDLEASGFFGIGIGIMILTPIVMIADASITFMKAGDRRYALITAAVAAILSLSIVIAFVIG